MSVASISPNNIITMSNVDDGGSRNVDEAADASSLTRSVEWTPPSEEPFCVKEEAMEEALEGEGPLNSSLDTIVNEEERLSQTGADAVRGPESSQGPKEEGERCDCGGDDRGVSTHFYSPAEMERILASFGANEERALNPVSSFLADRVAVAEPSVTPGAIITGAKKWWAARKKRRQRDQLARQAEQQRLILQMQTHSNSIGPAHHTADSNTHHRYYTHTDPFTDCDHARATTLGSGGSEDYVTIPSNTNNKQQQQHGIFGLASGTSDEFDSAHSHEQNGGASDSDDDKPDADTTHRGGNHLLEEDEGFVKIPRLPSNSSHPSLPDDVHSHSLPTRNDGIGDILPDVQIELEQNFTNPPLLSGGQMKSLVVHGLPSIVMFSKWKRLYSLLRDGDSFNGSFMRKVRGENRTLLVIKNTHGEVFGGYADSSWESQHGSMGAVFYGSAQAFLFTIPKKYDAATTLVNDDTEQHHHHHELGQEEDTGNHDESEVIVYKWTGANRYIQVCDVQAKILAFGGGGMDGEFGLCVEDDFRRGSTGKCETFGNEALCERDRFEIMDVEVWGFTTSGFCQ